MRNGRKHNVNAAIQKIPTLLAQTPTTTKTSARNELKLMSTILIAGWADLSQAGCSVSTIRRQRKHAVISKAKEIREKIQNFKTMEVAKVDLSFFFTGMGR